MIFCKELPKTIRNTMLRQHPVFHITWRGICDVPEPLVLAPGEGMYAKAADRRCRERFSASEPISGRKARATIIRRVSAASDVCLSSRISNASEPYQELQGMLARQTGVVPDLLTSVYGLRPDDVASAPLWRCIVL